MPTTKTLTHTVMTGMTTHTVMTGTLAHTVMTGHRAGHLGQHVRRHLTASMARYESADVKNQPFTSPA